MPQAGERGLSGAAEDVNGAGGVRGGIDVLPVRGDGKLNGIDQGRRVGAAAVGVLLPAAGRARELGQDSGSGVASKHGNTVRGGRPVRARNVNVLPVRADGQNVGVVDESTDGAGGSGRVRAAVGAGELGDDAGGGVPGEGDD